MTLRILYDNMLPASQRVQALIGIENFGTLIYRRRSLLNQLQAAVEAAGLEPPIELNLVDDWRRLEARLRNGDWAQDRFLICPSHIVSSDAPEAVALFLRQARHAPGSLVVPVKGSADWNGWALLSAPQLRDYLRKRDEGDVQGFFEAAGGDLIRLDGRLSLVDLDDEVALLNFLSGAFDVRFFNAIAQDQYTITKRSTDKAKLEREYLFYDLLPPAMQMFFVRPFDFTVEGNSASYRMERLHVPDMALQWLHGALGREEFGRLLDQLFHFLDSRARRSASAAEAGEQIEALFVTKVRQRIEALKATQEYATLKPLLERVCGDIDTLVARYERLLERARRRLPADHLVIGHGDLCFSNILYSKTSQFMRLIDPRGATSEADLYTHPYYDVAKLSHSILGGYDLINHDMFDVVVGEDMQLSLMLDRQPPEWAEAMFAERLQASGFDLDLVRLCEASLFISMLPLHIDRPRKVLGFAVNAAAMLDRLESSF